jgi:hypothetical protein
VIAPFSLSSPSKLDVLHLVYLQIAKKNGDAPIRAEFKVTPAKCGEIEMDDTKVHN